MSGPKTGSEYRVLRVSKVRKACGSKGWYEELRRYKLRGKVSEVVRQLRTKGRMESKGNRDDV